MKLLILAQQFFPDSVGGSARVAFEQARELASRGHKVHALVPKLEIKAKTSETISGVMIHRYGSGKLHMFGQSYMDVTLMPEAFDDLLERFKPDVLIAHQPTLASAALKAGFDSPLLYVFHASVPKEVRFQGLTGRGWWKRFFGWAFIRWMAGMEKLALDKAKKIIVLSDYSRKLVRESYPIESSKKVIQIPTGVDSEVYKPIRHKHIVRSFVGIPEDLIMFLTVRRLVPRMGLRNLLKAMIPLAKEYKDIRLYIVGEGPLKETLEKRVKRYDLEDVVTLTGRVREEDLPMFYQAADCFVLSTRAYEGLGIATLEALSTGLPVLGTPVGATREILSKVDKMLLFDSTNPKDIEKGMRWFLKEGRKDKDIVKKARALILKEYTWKAAGDALEEILNK